MIKRIKSRITQDGRESGKSLVHQQVRFVLWKSPNESVSGLWMGLDNRVSLRQIAPYFRKNAKVLNSPLTDRERGEFQRTASKLLKKNGIENVSFVWVPTN